MTHDATMSLTHDVHEFITGSVIASVCAQFGLELSLRSAASMANRVDDPAAFRAGMGAPHDAVAG
jgi:hypothetical protein